MFDMLYLLSMFSGSYGILAIELNIVEVAPIFRINLKPEQHPLCIAQS